MKMRARVRVTTWLDLNTDVPDLEHEPAAEGHSGMVATNERKVLAARKAAAKEAEREARKQNKGAIDVLIEEVVEA